MIEDGRNEDMRTRAKSLNKTGHHPRRGIDDDTVVFGLDIWMMQSGRHPVSRIGLSFVAFEQPLDHDAIICAGKVIECRNSMRFYLLSRTFTGRRPWKMYCLRFVKKYVLGVWRANQSRGGGRLMSR